MSDMKTFNVRDLDRKPGTVLNACDREGVVRVRRRDGRSYLLRRETPKPPGVSDKERKQWFDDHMDWLSRTFNKPISAQQTALVDRLISGE
jgi:hypothetical protein